MRIGMLTQWFDPEPGPAALPGVLARGLVDRGHQVQVVTGFPNYPTGSLAEGYTIRRQADEHLDGVDVRRVALWPSHDGSSVNRLGNYLSFSASALVNGLSQLRGCDAVWVNYSPITIGLPMWASRYLLGTPQVVHVLDLWPDTVIASGFSKPSAAGRVAERVMSTWCNAMYRAADSVAYISPGVHHLLAERGVPEQKLAYVPMWADESIFRPADEDLRGELGIAPDKVVLLYAGAMGEAQELSGLIDACTQIDDPRFLCLLAGSGISESSLREQAVGVDNVRFIGRFPQERMTRLCATSDINFVGLRPHPLSEFTMPSKTQAGLASGRALLVAAEGDVATVASDSGACLLARPEPDSIAAAIRRACELGREGLATLGHQAHSYYQKTFSVDRGVDQIEDLLTKAALNGKKQK